MTTALSPERTTYEMKRNLDVFSASFQDSVSNNLYNRVLPILLS